jgi:hypothetical protein
MRRGGSWRRNGLELVGKGVSDGGSVYVDFRDCALYPSYTQAQWVMAIVRLLDPDLGQ